ncbi:MAG TPA: hypothetical protein VFW65_04335 [Pseudonocardiaceae bacterium]|nr:hypothetical protein [Pseudonocardiaceae bacterium]
MGVFAVTTARGPAWDPARDIREQDGWDEHAAFADSLVDRRITVFGGPIGVGDTVGNAEDVALVVMELPDTDAVHETFAVDPWIVSGVLRLRSVRPWTLWLDGRDD